MKQSYYVQEERIYYSATTFRKLLDCLARPGKITVLEFPRFLSEPVNVSVIPSSGASYVLENMYALGALMTLLDKEVTFAVAAHGMWLTSGSPAVQWITLRSGARIASPDAAMFAFLADNTGSVLLPQLNQGTLLEPEGSATAFCCVERLADTTETIEQNEAGEAWVQLSLSGPGIEKSRTLSISQRDASFIDSMRAIHQQYPLGIDVYLVDAMGRCVGLPRTTHIQHEYSFVG